MPILQSSYIGRPHSFFDVIDSTNSYSLELLSKSNPIEGTAISAGYQVNGRGQIGRKWEGEQDKNLYTSIILKPSFIPANDHFCLNQAVALAVSSLIDDYISIKSKIKWPNDIYVENRKICGILIQNILSGANIQFSVIGIGININQEEFHPDIPNPTSFYMENNSYVDIVEVRNSLFYYVEYWYEMLKEDKNIEINSHYHKKMYRIGQITSFKYENSYIRGTIEGVDEKGKLKLKKENETIAYNLNEIKMLID